MRFYPGRGLDYAVARYQRRRAWRRAWQTALVQVQLTVTLLSAILLAYRLLCL